MCALLFHSGSHNSSPRPTDPTWKRHKKNELGGTSMKALCALCIMLVGMGSNTQRFEPFLQSLPSQSAEQETQKPPSEANGQEVPFDQDAATLATTGSIYQTASITQITSQTPGGPWAISGHVSVTGFVMAFARQVDGDLHVPFCDSPQFSVPSNGSSLPDKHHCVMAEVVPYLKCAVLPHLPVQQTIRGLLRFDGGPSAEWWEIHPIEFMTSGSCH